jgi:hypothetical protein
VKNRSIIVLTLLGLALGAATAVADPLFGGKFDFATGSYPYSVAIGDLNGDGIPDLATANYGSASVSVLLGTGDGTFTPRTDFTTGNSPRFVAIGDLNADGKPDLVTANLFSAKVSVLLGHGDGTFGTKTDFSTGSQPYAVAIGDLNADGKPDLAVANSVSNTVSVLLGNGSGTFGAKTDYPTGSGPRSVAIGDLNGDGKPDLAVAAGVGISLLPGNGNGTFGPKTDITTGSQPVSVAIGDVNVDGNPDLVVANYNSNTISVLQGHGNGSFAARADYATSLGPFVVAIGDLSGDGNPDLAVANSSANSVSVMLGSGGGSFGVKTDYATGTGPFSVAIGDLDRDGKLDLAVTNYGSNTVSVMLSRLAPSATVLHSSPNPSRNSQLVTLTAIVTPAGATGSVTFRDGPDSIGTAGVTGGAATITTSSFAVGNHSLSARYGGNGALEPSLSPVAVHTVLPPDSTTLVLKANPNPSVIGQTVLLTASITPTIANGIVEFRDGGTLIGNAALYGGSATMAMPNRCGGTYSFTAVYTGVPGYYGSTSPAVTHVVNPAATATTVVSTLNPARLAEPVGFAAHVGVTGPAPCPLTGTVEFVIDGVSAGSAELSIEATAVLTDITTLTSGPHTVRAVYTGNASFLGSTSPAITQEIEAPSPWLVSVSDLPDDQGGQVELFWKASYLDLPPYNSIESYWVLRSASPMAASRAIAAGARVSRPGLAPEPRVGSYLAVELQGATYYWEYIASQPALHAPDYNFVAPTTSDSLPGSNPLTIFMLLARTAAGAEWWFSNADSGYSVDNLAPPAPAQFAGAYASGVTTLEWAKSPEADLGQYRLYRGPAADFVPGPGNLVVAQADTGYVDAAAGTLSYYKLCAVDVHGNPSGFTTLLPASTTGVGDGGALAFALDGVRPNPSRGDRVSVAFTLPTPAHARLELVDVSGRRVVEREVGALGAGRHVVALDTGGRLAPGLYLVRLTQGADSRVTRVAVVK